MREWDADAVQIRIDGESTKNDTNEFQSSYKGYQKVKTLSIKISSRNAYWFEEENKEIVNLQLEVN